MSKNQQRDAADQFELAMELDFCPREKHRAIYWYTKAAEQGHAEAQNYLGELLRDAARDGEILRNGRPDRFAAVKWFRRAAEQGESSAQLSLGYSLFYGEGTRRDPEEALAWYRRAARKGERGAMVNIAHMYRCGDVVKQSWALAIHWYKKAAEKGSAAAYHWLGRIYGRQEEDYPTDHEEAARWLRLAADAGDAQSQCDLGVAYHEGLGVDRDFAEAARLYRLAAEQGDEWATYCLYLCYRDGDGVRRNRRWARHWLEKAAALGVKQAQAKLETLRGS